MSTVIVEEPRRHRKVPRVNGSISFFVCGPTRNDRSPCDPKALAFSFGCGTIRLFYLRSDEKWSPVRRFAAPISSVFRVCRPSSASSPSLLPCSTSRPLQLQPAVRSPFWSQSVWVNISHRVVPKKRGNARFYTLPFLSYCIQSGAKKIQKRFFSDCSPP